MRVEVALDPIRRPGESEPRAIVGVRDREGQLIPDMVRYLGPNETVAVVVDEEKGPARFTEIGRNGPKEVDMGVGLDQDEISTPVRLYPQTAREALLEIRRRAAEVHVDMDVTDLGCEIDRVALEGLARTEPINFELSDQLADRLAEAHGLLQRLLGATREWPVSTEITEALALPPDLETIVERRIGHR